MTFLFVNLFFLLVWMDVLALQFVWRNVVVRRNADLHSAIWGDLSYGCAIRTTSKIAPTKPEKFEKGHIPKNVWWNKNMTELFRTHLEWTKVLTARVDNSCVGIFARVSVDIALSRMSYD